MKAGKVLKLFGLGFHFHFGFDHFTFRDFCFFCFGLVWFGFGFWWGFLCFGLVLTEILRHINICMIWKHYTEISYVLIKQT